MHGEERLEDWRLRTSAESSGIKDGVPVPKDPTCPHREERGARRGKQHRKKPRVEKDDKQTTEPTLPLNQRKVAVRVRSSEGVLKENQNAKKWQPPL